jgi:hypothetical protein
VTHLPDPQIQTLYATARTNAANLDRILARGPVVSPHAYDLAAEALSESLTALHQALLAPLDYTGWRRVDLVGGRYAEVFTTGCGAAYALRQIDPKAGGAATIFCRSYPHPDEAQRAFSMTVYLSAAHNR